MGGKGGGFTISELVLSGLFAYWGWHHPFWGMGAIPSALVAILIGTALWVCALLALFLIGALVVALFQIRREDRERATRRGRSR